MNKMTSDNIFNNLISQTQFKKAQKSWWGQLYGCSLSLAISQLIQKDKRFIVLVTKDIPSAQVLQHELSFFLNHIEINIFQFPDWETLAYEHFSPHQDIISERLSTLYHLPQQKQGILIIPVFSLMQRLPPPDYIQQNTLMINQGDLIDIDQFRLDMVQKGYYSVNTVYEHGEFCVRGSIIDIFPMGSPHPFRLDLFDDELETIKTF
ncbi:MAG: transcription-repair coupling factor, partial [Gammaproteobacteria bacterium]|nr:transcription-repair coupling factor [Gammaproteobacteria bacterium]